MFIELANSIIKKNGVNINEAAITTQDIAEPIFNTIKKIIFSLSDKIASFNQNAPLYPRQVDIIINDINEQIKQSSLNSPVPIEFTKEERDNLGAYNRSTKKIKLNANNYLVDYVNELQQGIPEDEQRIYKLKDPQSIDFDNMYETIEHELIHQQQDVKSGGKLFNIKDKSYDFLKNKYDTNKNNKLDDDEIKNIAQNDYDAYKSVKYKEDNKNWGELLKKREEIAPGLDRNTFLNKVKYYNNPAEINTFAKDTVNSFVKQTYNAYINYFRQNNIPANLSAEQMKTIVLAPFLNASETNVFQNQAQQESTQVDQNQQQVIEPQQQTQQPQQQPQQQSQKNQELRNKLQQNKNAKQQQQQQTGIASFFSKFKITQDMKQKETKNLLSLYPGYKFLTSANKQKWWNYAYQLLNSMKFTPIVYNPQNTNNG